MRQFGLIEKSFKAWRNTIWQRYDEEKMKSSWGYTMGKLVRKMHSDLLMPWVLKATFRNWANCRGKSRFGKNGAVKNSKKKKNVPSNASEGSEHFPLSPPNRSGGISSYGVEREEFGNITCILPKCFFNPNHEYKSAVEVGSFLEGQFRIAYDELCRVGKKKFGGYVQCSAWPDVQCVEVDLSEFFAISNKMKQH